MASFVGAAADIVVGVVGWLVWEVVRWMMSGIEGEEL
jgi:hypothetical protein